MEQELRIEKTVRFEVLNAEHQPKKVIYVLHGYGQLAKYFIRKFAHLSNDFLIVAPEGLHRFYLQGNAGRVGASWMTKEARESDISDTIRYLNHLDEKISAEYSIQERYLLGFSQGGAAAARWFELGNVPFQAVALWGCVFPPDLKVTKFTTPHKKTFFLVGDQDEFYADQHTTLTETYAEMGFQIIIYNGGHDIVNETLTELIKKLEALE